MLDRRAGSKEIRFKTVRMRQVGLLKWKVLLIRIINLEGTC